MLTYGHLDILYPKEVGRTSLLRQLHTVGKISTQLLNEFEYFIKWREWVPNPQFLSTLWHLVQSITDCLCWKLTSFIGQWTSLFPTPPVRFGQARVTCFGHLGPPMLTCSFFHQPLHSNKAPGFNEHINEHPARDRHIIEKQALSMQTWIHKHMYGQHAIHNKGHWSGVCCTRLTWLSVFDLSIRAQTLAMWPLTPRRSASDMPKVRGHLSFLNAETGLH